jgi:hypothetical protein
MLPGYRRVAWSPVWFLQRHCADTPLPRFRLDELDPALVFPNPHSLARLDKLLGVPTVDVLVASALAAVLAAMVF